MTRIAVIGSGSWGTAMAAVFATAGVRTVLWGRDAAKMAALAATRRHPELGDAALPETLGFTADAATLRPCDLIIWAVPTQHSAAIATRLAADLSPQAPLVSLSKGIEQGTLRRVSELLAAALPGRAIATLAGPSHAAEVVRGLPVCLVAAGPEALTAQVLALLHRGPVRLYSSTDLVGVELAGAMKNVIAIAAGIAEGLGLGDNAKAAVITRGLAELRRLGRICGADDATFAGLAGIGDLLTTCYSPHGRNRALGVALGRGATVSGHLAERATVAEGAHTSRAMVDFGRQVGVELPLTSEVASVCWAARPVATALEALLARAPKEENA